jgi:GNAT superfamily N-acetyltransferase
MIEKYAIRRYERRDREAVKRLHILTLGKIYKSGPWEEDLDHIEESYIQDGGEFLVVEVDLHIIAMGAIRRMNESTAELKRMRVHPDFWRRGIGQMLLERLEFVAKGKGYQVMELDTTTLQKPAQQLYIKNHYQEVKRGMRGPFDCIFYRKEL